jgi:hypothetical protein
MKIRFRNIFGAWLACIFTVVAATPALAGRFPDIPGLLTLHCDLHMHTVFSDGEVWPAIRVQEALAEKLDCIAITDHLKFGKMGKHPEVQADRNRSYEIAAEAATGSDLIVIRGAEITQGMPPGHISGVFLTDSNIAHEDHFDTLATARDQGAFLIWNHPSWKSPDKKWEQDGIAGWFEEHERLVANGTIRGLEIVNGRTYSSEAHRWALEKKLTMIGSSDIHRLVSIDYDLENEHRPQTLVFAEERSASAIRDALFKRRTAVWYDGSLIGDPEFLEPVFHACVTVDDTRYLENLAVATVSNRCGMSFHAENTSDFEMYNSMRFFEFRPEKQRIIVIKTGAVLEQFDLSLSIKNLHTAPDAYLHTRLGFKSSGAITDKSVFKSMASD